MAKKPTESPLDWGEIPQSNNSCSSNGLFEIAIFLNILRHNLGKHKTMAATTLGY
jgi:hypothetical protein